MSDRRKDLWKDFVAEGTTVIKGLKENPWCWSTESKRKIDEMRSRR